MRRSFCIQKTMMCDKYVGLQQKIHRRASIYLNKDGKFYIIKYRVFRNIEG